MADIIASKHRKGPVGSIRLEFRDSLAGLESVQ